MTVDGRDENCPLVSSPLPTLSLRRGKVSSLSASLSSSSRLSTIFLSFSGLSGTLFITLYTGKDSFGGAKAFVTGCDGFDVAEEQEEEEEDEEGVEEDAFSALSAESRQLSKYLGSQ